MYSSFMKYSSKDMVRLGFHFVLVGPGFHNMVVVGPGFQDIVVVLVVGGPVLQGSLTGCCCWSWLQGHGCCCWS